MISDVKEFAAAIAAESRLDLPTQRLRLAQRLVNLPEEKLQEIHLAEWYANFWKLAGADLPPAPEISQQILSAAEKVSATRRQLCLLALLMFGNLPASVKRQFDKNLWSEKLREDFELYEHWKKLTTSPYLKVRASLARNEQVKKFLLEKYSALIEKYSAAGECSRAEKFRIWYCWFQGEENLPPLVRCCYNSLRENSGGCEICFVDEKNFSEYVELAPHILQKFADGKISRTHLSDILRVNLLERYGGLWLDATILVTEPLENHRDLLERRYFTQKFYREKSADCPYAYNPSYGRWATFAQGSAYKNHPLFAFMKDFYECYWRDFDSVLDYVLMDFAMDIAYEKIPAVRADMDAVPVNNPDANTLVFHLNDSYKNYPYDKILAQTFLHKLNWRAKIDFDAPDSVYQKIRRRYLGE